MNMPHIASMISDLKPLAGDLIAVDRGGLLSELGKSACSGDEPCFTYHGGIVVDSRPTKPLGCSVLSTLNVHYPYATIDPLASYLASIRCNGGRFVIVRPTWAVEVESCDQALLHDWRQCANSAAYMLEGQPYPITDLWVVFKALQRMRIPFVKDRFAVYCWQSVEKIYRNNSERPFTPIGDNTLSAAIHWERAMRAGEFRLIQEYPMGFWREIITATT